MSTSGAELVLGALPILSPGESDQDYTIEALGEGTTWGTPEAVVATVASMLMDGEKAKITRFGNREASIPLQIRGATLDVVAEGEAALMLEVNRGRNTLAWTPPNWATPSVFDVVYSVLDFQFDDLAETTQVTRHYTLKLICLPGARRAEPTTVIAEPIPDVTPTSTEIDTCSSLTGWSSPLGSLSLVSGNIVAHGYPWTAERTGLSVTVGDEKYLTVDLSGPLSPALSTYVQAGPNAWANGSPGTALTFITSESISGGFRCYFLIPDAITTITSVTFAGGATTDMTLFSVGKANVPGITGSRKQRSFSLTIGGTARTAVDLVIEAESALGRDLVLYTAPDGSARAPSMRQWRVTSDSPTTDIARVSGARHTFTDPSVYRRPVTVTPPGTYLMVALLAKTGGSADVTFTWSADLYGHAYDSASPAESGEVTVPLTSSYRFHELGVVTLPPSGISPTSDAFIEFDLDASAATASIDDFWLFNLDTGVLTRIDGAPTSSGPTKFEARSATIDYERPGWVLGTAGTADDDIEVPQLVKSAGVHELPPGAADVFIITTSAETQTITADLYERFQHHVPPLGS